MICNQIYSVCEVLKFHGGGMCIGIYKKAPYMGNNREKRLGNFALGSFSGMVTNVQKLSY